MSITQHHVLQAVDVYLEAGVTPLLIAEPGTGKTSGVRDLCTRRNYHFEVEILSQKDAAEVGGLPVRTEMGVVYELPAWAKRVIGTVDRRKVVLLDEMNLAPPSTQGPMLTVICDKEIQGVSLGDDVHFIACVNPVEQSAGAWDLTAPMANRFGHLRWPVDVDTFAQGLLGMWPDVTLPSQPTGWEDNKGHYGALVGSFLQRRDHLLVAVPDSEVAAGGPWPSPRTWEWVRDVLAICEAAGADPVVRMLAVHGLVGEGPGGELLEYLDKLNLPDPEDLLAHPDRFVLPEQYDQHHAVLASVTAAVLRKTTVKRWEAAMLIMVAAARGGAADVAGVNVMVLAKAGRPAGAKLPAAFDEFLPTINLAGLGTR